MDTQATSCRRSQRIPTIGDVNQISITPWYSTIDTFHIGTILSPDTSFGNGLYRETGTLIHSGQKKKSRNPLVYGLRPEAWCSLGEQNFSSVTRMNTGFTRSLVALVEALDLKIGVEGYENRL